MSVAVAQRPTATATPTPSLTAVFRSAVRSEWTKLFTVRSTVWTLIFIVVSLIGIGAAITGLEVYRWDVRTPADIAGFDPLVYSLAGINIAQMPIVVLGVLVMTSEYTTGVIRLTFGATPQRGLVLAAKVLVFSAVVAVVTFVSCLAAFFLCQQLLAPKHADVTITDPGVFRTLLGGVAHSVGVGAMALGIGAALRRTAGAISILFGVLYLVPGLVLLLPSPWSENVTKYLPNSAGVAMSALIKYPDLLSPWQGFILLTVYGVAILSGAMVLMIRRDA